ncbi:MAG: gluconokinase [Chloracidobacterium sp.]|nr:gluconokinase [Chloracidobacterium sp.]
MELPLILALDIGSSSVRVSLFDSNAQPLPKMSVKIEHSFTATKDGGSEMDAEKALSQITKAVDAILKKSEKVKGEIGYVASCAFLHSLVGVDAKGKPTTKVFGWADTRSRKYSAVLKKRFDEKTLHNRTGAHFHSSFWPAKLIWLRREFPDTFAKTAKWLSFSDFVALRLFGEAATSISMASATGIFDIRRCIWDSELLKYLKLKTSSLPSITDTDSTTCTLNKTFAKRWPRLKQAEWFPAIGDGMADNIGAGCVTKNKAALMIGTSAAMRVAYKGDPPKNIPDGLWCYRIDRNRVIIGGALSDGGNLYAWLKKNLKLPKNAEADMRKRGAAFHGLGFMPFFFGERSTGYNENAGGAVLGLNSSHDSIDIMQAAMESVAYRFAEIFDQLNSVVKIKQIVASGGASRESPVWTQIIADVFGRDLLMNNASESSSRGAVLLVLESIGKIGSIENLSTPEAAKTEYHPKCHKIYKLERKKHGAVYDSLLKRKP